MYPKPTPPISCCGRGCEECVWVSYNEALERWYSCMKQSEKDSRLGGSARMVHHKQINPTDGARY